MTIILPTLPGLTPSAVHNVPTNWDGTWYKRHIRDFLQWADVRNAHAGPGITITGNLNGPATISLAGGAVLVSGTIVTAKLTVGGTNGSQTFSNGVLIAQTPAT